MYCEKCGRKIDDDAPACPYCGTKTERSSKNGGGFAILLQFDSVVLAAIIIMIPLCLYLIVGRKNESKGNEAQPDSQVTAVEQSDQADAVEEQDQSAAVEQSDQADAVEEQDQSAAAEQSDQKSADEEIANQAPAYAMAYNGHHYYIYDEGEISFSEAAEKCEESGGHLAKIDNEDENEELYFYMLDMGFDQAFFGVVYEESMREWINYDGTEAAFFDWGTNSAGIEEPNNSGGNEYNVQLDVNMRDGHWNDAEFGAKVYTPEGESYKDRYSYICEWDY